MTACRRPQSASSPVRVVVAGLVLLLTVALTAIFHGQAYWLAWHWDRQIDLVDTAEAEKLLRQLALLGEPAVDRLVQRLADDRPGVGRAAYERLLDSMAEFEALDHAVASQRTARLAAALAAAVDSLPPAGQQFAADLAVRLLVRSSERSLDAPAEAMAACEHVLRRAAPHRNRSETSPARVTADRRSEAQRAALRAIAAEPAAEALVLPGGGLPMAPVDPVEVDAAAPENDLASEGPATDAHPLRPQLAEPRRLPLDETQATPLPHVVTNESASPPRATTESPHDRLPHAEANEPETIQLVRMLHSSDAEKAGQAERELRKQGFSQRHLEIGRRLADPDPQVRRQWTEMLPRIRGIDARPWLLWLTHDPDAEVRLLAITLLATSNDPELVDRMRELSQSDPDPQIRQQAERYLGLDPRRRR